MRKIVHKIINVTEEIIRNYIAHQGNKEKDEIFKIEGEFMLMDY